MIIREHGLPITKQAKALRMSRGSVPGRRASSRAKCVVTPRSATTANSSVNESP